MAILPAFFPFLMILFWVVAPVFAEGGRIDGTISLNFKDGQTAFGYRLSVFLVTEKFPVIKPDLSQADKMKQIDALASAHIDFFKAFREKLNRPGYLVTDTVSTPKGLFQFKDISPGNYFIVVAFPSMVNGIKVAWQVPVQVTPDKAVKVNLANDNLALPTYSRTGQAEIK
jgi:hypothetical protein